MNPYVECPTVATEHFTFRLIRQEDSDSLFLCYNDRTAVSLMNDDNCDFGFFTGTPEQMATTVGYWLDFYSKQYFIRFAIVDNRSGEAVGTVEGFAGQTGVLRIDIMSRFEQTEYLTEILDFAKQNFFDYFGNEYLVTKACTDAKKRRLALESGGWEYIDLYRGYHDYYRIATSRS